jgi:hypothetical protein
LASSGVVCAMAQQPNDENKLAQQKRDIARRAKRLAQSQLVETDRARLGQFANELDEEAEALERLATSSRCRPLWGHKCSSRSGSNNQLKRRRRPTCQREKLSLRRQRVCDT